MAKVLREELFRLYPEQILLITNIDRKGAVVVSAEVVKTNVTRDEALHEQILSKGKVEMFSTINEPFWSVGLIG